MILKGNQRGGGQQLAAHLMNSFDNERVEVADVRGAVARDLSGAFNEWYAHSRATKCKKYLYSLSLNPDQTQGHLSREQYLDLVARTERSLRLVNQPRAVVFHVKEGREHCHVVWSRIDINAEKIRSVQIAHDRLKLRTVVREFARENGLRLPAGMATGKTDDRRVFNAAARAENLGEKQQQERTGVPKAVRMEEIAACWNSTSDGASFVKALEAKNYHLAHGDERDYVVVDLYGEVHSLSRQLSGTTRPKPMRDRLKDFPVETLRDVATTQAYVKQLREERERQRPAQAERSEAAQRVAALQARQQSRRDVLARMRADMFARQTSERAELRNMQAGENEAIAAKRQPGRFTAFLTRITGVRNIVAWAHGQADKKRVARHARQTEALLLRHAHEQKAIDRHEAALDRIERRENASARLALRRETYWRLRVFPLKPEFDKAISAEQVSAAAGDARRLAEQFKQRAKDVDFRKGDLQKAYERATSEKPSTEGGAEGARKPRSERPKPPRDRERDDP